MDFSFTPDQQQITTAIEQLCSDFPNDYWLARDRDGEYPHQFHA
ncbi:MAG: acyl-CoA dehydrogenase, partial [Paucimonas sp.]|nr:acyl-CoA dehydrogenase [Paucimonas sp.]